MRDIAIIGAGGLGREVRAIIEQLNDVRPTWNIVGFYDDGLGVGVKIGNYSVIGSIDTINDWSLDLDVVIAIANGSVIKNIISRITKVNVIYPNIIAPDVKFYDTNEVKMGYGNIIGVGSIISTNFNIGNFNIFSCMVNVGHDLQIGNFNSFTNGCTLSGNVCIDNNTFWGTRSTILPNKSVVSDSIIGAGAVVIKDITDKGTYVGFPAKKIK